MAKVWCASIECKHNKNNQCIAKEINLSEGYANTFHQGYMQYWKCRSFKESKEAKEIKKLISGERRTENALYFVPG